MYILKMPDYIAGILVEGDGFEPSKSATTDLQSAPFGHSGTPPHITIQNNTEAAKPSAKIL